MASHTLHLRRRIECPRKHTYDCAFVGSLDEVMAHLKKSAGCFEVGHQSVSF